MIEVSCHCGSVRLQLAQAPTAVTECTCTICRRYGALWAYYPLEQVATPPAELTETYSRGEHSIAFHRCRRCGCVSHWFPITRTENRMGVNARLMDLAVIANARVRHLDGAVTEQYID